MRRYSIAVLLAALTSVQSVALAQEALSVDINRASFAWEWSQGTGGVPDGFRLACGGKSREYLTSVDFLGESLRTAPVRDVVKTTGEYFCVVMSYNRFGASDPSNEVHFFAGSVPNLPSNFLIIAQ